MKKWISIMACGISAIATEVCAEWTPLISSNDFTGIRTDLGTAVAGIITLVLIVFGVMMMVRVMVGK